MPFSKSWSWAPTTKVGRTMPLNADTIAALLEAKEKGIDVTAEVAKEFTESQNSER